MNTIEPKTGLINAIHAIKSEVNQLYNNQKIQKYQHQKFIEQLEKLEDIKESLDFYDNHPLYMLLHRELHRIHNTKMQIDSFIVKINLKSNSCRPALLTFDLFPMPETSKNPGYEFS